MRPFSYAGYHYNCSIPLLYISLVNLSLSMASLSVMEFDIVKTSSRINGTYLAEILSYLLNGVTLIISITTIFGTLYSSRKLILLLLIWDGYRFLFAAWAATGARSDYECFHYVCLEGWLVLCFFAEMIYLVQPKTHTMGAMLGNRRIYNSHERLNANYPPRYEDIPPPPYSPRESSSSSSVQTVQPTSSTVFTITERYSAEAASSLEILPPSYESLGFEKNHRF